MKIKASHMAKALQSAKLADVYRLLQQLFDRVSMTELNEVELNPY